MTVCYAVGGCKSDVNPSHAVWRAIMSLQHKNIPFIVQGLKYKDIRSKVSELTGGKWDRVPLVVFDDDSQLYNSSEIAKQLDLKYPNQPKLFPNGDNFFKFMSNVSRNVFFPLFLLAAPSFMNMFEPEDLEAFLAAEKESYGGTTLETLIRDNNEEEALQKVKLSMKPFIEVLKTSKFLEGDTVTYSDYHFFADFQLLKISANTVFQKAIALDETNTLISWFDSISDMYAGFAKDALIFPGN